MFHGTFAKGNVQSETRSGFDVIIIIGIKFLKQGGGIGRDLVIWA